MVHRALAAALILTFATLGCADSAPPLAPADEDPGSVPEPLLAHGTQPRDAHGTQPRDADFNKQLAELRKATAKFHRFDAAVAAGWGTQITPCLENPPLGGQGFHYGNVALIDGTVNLTTPELLMYEPRPNGLRFVGVEYIVPFDFVPATDPAPSVLGQDFHADTDIGLWVLHVWVPLHNPSGMFAHWNPKVSC